jgi:hypothetical protein
MNQWLGWASVPFITGLVQIVKPWVSDERWYPIISLAVGVAWNVGITISQGGDVPLAFVQGVGVGLAACGLYSSDKALRRVG